MGYSKHFQHFLTQARARTHTHTQTKTRSRYSVKMLLLMKSLLMPCACEFGVIELCFFTVFSTSQKISHAFATNPVGFFSVSSTHFRPWEAASGAERGKNILSLLASLRMSHMLFCVLELVKLYFTDDNICSADAI